MIIGIDLGTTHSLAGVMTEQGPTLVPNALGEVLTPSVVGLGDDGSLLVGAAAHERLHSHPHLTAATFKRHMGSDRELTLGERRFRPEELSALVIKSLIHDVEAHTGATVTEAVISVPAYFSDAQRKATRNAATLAGIRVERLINEPTAAALAYGLDQRDAESRFLVVDLGGGTFDVSVLELFDGVVEVHATAGDNFLGGEDFIDLMAGMALADLGLADSKLSPGDRAILRHRLETLKKRLSRESEAEVDLPLHGNTHRWRLSQDRLFEAARPLIERMRAPIERAMRDARLTPAQVDEVVIVGGASRMPMVARMVSTLLGRLPLRHLNPDEAIGLGATVMAGLKSRHATLEETVITDVCPYTLGIEVAHEGAEGLLHGNFQPLIERNTTIPASRERTFTPLRAHQRELELRVFQGESPRVANNILLGTLKLELPPFDHPQQMPVVVRFTYDVNGLLEVEATLPAIRRGKRLVIEQNPGLLSPAEIEARLKALSALKLHPREQQANLALISRAERLYEEFLGDTRQDIMTALLSFRTILESQDEDRIRHARQQFSQWLAGFGGTVEP